MNIKDNAHRQSLIGSIEDSKPFKSLKVTKQQSSEISPLGENNRREREMLM